MKFSSLNQNALLSGTFPGSLALAFFLHLAGYLSLETYRVKTSTATKQDPVKIKIIDPPPPPPMPAPLPPPPPVEKKEVPKKIVKVKKEIKKKKKVATIRKKTTKSKQKPKKVKVVQGLSKESFSKGSGPGISAPVGNTLLAEDKGIRVKEVEKITEDLSSPEKLIFFKPPSYTEDALDAGIEGDFKVDVYINKKGDVIKAELRRKIGFGMDKKVLNSVYQAKYTPRSNKVGLPVETWTTLTCTLILDE